MINYETDNSIVTMLDKEIEQDKSLAAQKLVPSVDFNDVSEDSIAMRFAQAHPQFRWVQLWGHWLEWDGTVWLHDERLRVYTHVREFIRYITKDFDDRQIRQLKKAATISAIERLARSDRLLVASTGQWDQDAFILNTDGGIVNLIDGTISNHDPKSYLTKKTPHEPGGNCDRWLAFLDEATDGDKELATFLQRVIGYSLTALCVNMPCSSCMAQGATAKEYS